MEWLRCKEGLTTDPPKRDASRDDVADAVLFLCTAPWLTGEVLDLNRGAPMRRYPDLMSRAMKPAAQ